MSDSVTDYAIDIETLGISRLKLPAIVEIGAVAFDRETGRIIDQFEAYIDLDSSLKYGDVDADTLRFWFSQSTVKSVMNRGIRSTIPDAITALNGFIRCPGKKRVWSWGSEFDFRILLGAFERTGYAPAFDFHDVRDARGYCLELADQFSIELPMQDQSSKHMAIDDAKHCARLVSGMYQQMMVIKERVG